MKKFCLKSFLLKFYVSYVLNFVLSQSILWLIYFLFYHLCFNYLDYCYQFVNVLLLLYITTYNFPPPLITGEHKVRRWWFKYLIILFTFTLSWHANPSFANYLLIIYIILIKRFHFICGPHYIWSQNVEQCMINYNSIATHFNNFFVIIPFASFTLTGVIWFINSFPAMFAE